ncbi:hypothetical protein H5410_050883 [Solanum commersonii]|uniref:Uncharacterized protein n=1 Tax=Solanum commersonii TaxID=4109 RepID=A0A9J5WZA7_SOLCO|nr:hypothetical protein H5410_050883 [Solanum commersonii]
MRYDDDQGGGYHSFEENVKSYCSQMFFDKQEDIKMKENTIIETDPLTFLKFFAEYLSMVVTMKLMPHNRIVMISSLIIFAIVGGKSMYHTNQDCSQIDLVKELIDEKLIFNTLGSDEEVVQVYKGLKTYRADDPLLFKNVKRNIQENYNNKGKTWIAELIDTYFNSTWSLTALIVNVFLTFFTIVQTNYGSPFYHCFHE